MSVRGPGSGNPKPAIDPYLPEPAIDPVPRKGSEPEPAILPTRPIDDMGNPIGRGGVSLDPSPPGAGRAFGSYATDPNIVSGHERHLLFGLRSALAAVQVGELTHASDWSAVRGFRLGDGGYQTSNGEPLMMVRLNASFGPPGAASSGSSELGLVNPNDNTWRLVRARGLDPGVDYSQPMKLPAGIGFTGTHSAGKVRLLEKLANEG